MELEDLASTESAVVAAVTATVLSPRVREVMRRGAVYGVAGVLKAGDVVVGAARGAAQGVRDGSAHGGAGTGATDARATGGTGARATGGGEAGETAEPAPPSRPAAATPRATGTRAPARRRAPGVGS